MESKVDSYGRILVPKELRDRLGFSADTPVELEIDDDEKLIIRRKGESGLIERYGLLVYRGGRVTEEAGRVARQVRRGRDEKLRGIFEEGEGR